MRLCTVVHKKSALHRLLQLADCKCCGMNADAECPTASSSRVLQAKCIATNEPCQDVHKPMLAVRVDQHRSESFKEIMMPITGGRTQEYCDWWCEQVLGQDNHSLFSVRLIGDASSPQLYTLMAHNDLAFCRYAGCTSLISKRGSTTKLGGTMFSQVAFACHAKFYHSRVFTASGVTTELWSI